MELSGVEMAQAGFKPPPDMRLIKAIPTLKSGHSKSNIAQAVGFVRSDRASVQIWDVDTGKTIRRIDISRLAPSKQSEDHGIVRRARFIDGGRAIVVTADAHPVRVFDVATGEPVAEVPYKHPDPPFIETSASGLVVLGSDAATLWSTT